MSFSLTTPQYRDFSKTVTRRIGWKMLKPGEIFMGVVKGMGLKKGEKVQYLHPATCLSNRTEPLTAITQEDCVKEGFPKMTPAEFVRMFCEHNKCRDTVLVQRIEFAHIASPFYKGSDGLWYTEDPTIPRD